MTYHELEKERLRLNAQALAWATTYGRQVVKDGVLSVDGGDALRHILQTEDDLRVDETALDRAPIPHDNIGLYHRLILCLDTFSPGAAETVMRNRHMNQLPAEPPVIVSEQEVRRIVAPIIERAMRRHGGSTNAVAVCDSLANAARFFYRDTVAVESAIAIGFINFCGLRWGVDYCMYTSDLNQ
jgi:hypothetical protein